MGTKTKGEWRPSVKSRRRMCEELAELGEPLMFVEGHDDAILGVAEREGVEVVVYDSVSVIRGLQRRDGMSKDGAEEFFGCNIAGAWMGDGSPVFLRRA